MIRAYTLAIHSYAFVVRCLSVVHPKARKMCAGQRDTFRLLSEGIDRNAPWIWFHASSLGEFEQGRPLMEKIKSRHPHGKLLLTFFSPSGYEVRRDYPGADLVCYLPFDTPRRVKKFLDLANPRLAVFIKYEFWANYLLELKSRAIPTYSVSSVFRSGQLFFRCYGRPYLRLLECFDHLFVQDESSASLLGRYGIRRVSVSGDTRFDRVLQVRSEARRLPLVEAFVKNAPGGKRPILVAGSTWLRDESLLLPYFNQHPDLRLIIAPHEINSRRLREIRSRLLRPVALLSEAEAGSITRCDCLIVDSFGLLSCIYRYADMAYVGGGFGKGIHNLLEAAVYGIPVLFGPVHRKFKEAQSLIALGGGFSIPDFPSLSRRIDRWLERPDLRTLAGEAAGEFVKTQAGATETVLKHLTPRINNRISD
ncbi:MAG: 3-deoxy-D-manno-octulosonic acid transferase [Tannerellaceae bacterium]|jgi:3-deoxy-D-manno-octulosonic-acid transferase|nr:3-deoxy-D-manno-octulosonic acid transferase [Tannerellaceae bacterium]